MFMAFTNLTEHCISLLENKVDFASFGCGTSLKGSLVISSCSSSSSSEINVYTENAMQEKNCLMLHNCTKKIYNYASINYLQIIYFVQTNLERKS